MSGKKEILIDKLTQFSPQTYVGQKTEFGLYQVLERMGGFQGGRVLVQFASPSELPWEEAKAIIIHTVCSFELHKLKLLQVDKEIALAVTCTDLDQDNNFKVSLARLLVKGV